MKFETVI